MSPKIQQSDLEKIIAFLQENQEEETNSDAIKQLSRLAALFGCEAENAAGDLISPSADSPLAGSPLSLIRSLPAAKLNISDFSFSRPIQEVTLGADKKSGGTRKSTVTIGGEKTMPYFFDAEMPNKSRVTMDVFDMPVSLAKSVRSNYEDVIDDPAAWAKKAVREFGADMITIHLVSTDPNIKDTSARDAAKTVEDILQAVSVPIVIGGSGNPKKDPEILEAAAAAAQGERALIASANLNMDYKRIGTAAKENGHVVLSWTQMDINAQKELNRKLIRQCGITPDSIIMDPTTAALGYGLDYAYSNMERIRLAGLLGDEELAFPMSSGTTNAWGAREAWMIASPLAQDSDWGDREYRGPIWEIITGLTLALAGNDLFMMMHPRAVKYLKETMTLFSAGSVASKSEAEDAKEAKEKDAKKAQDAKKAYDAWLTGVY